MNIYVELQDIIKCLTVESNQLNDEDLEKLRLIKETIHQFEKSFSGSWLGYHANVYYKDFQTPPPRAKFSLRDGLHTIYSDTIGEWIEYSPESVIQAIENTSGNLNLTEVNLKAEHAKDVFINKRSELLTLISITLESRTTDYLMSIKKKLEDEKFPTKSLFLDYWKPAGTYHTYDNVAVQQGIKYPPHKLILANLMEIHSQFTACKNLAEIANDFLRYIKKTEGIVNMTNLHTTIGKIFIGHGGSSTWRDLKDFIQDRLELNYDEFNRVSPAGLATKERLSQMLNNANFAFLVMTAEDEQADGNLQARQNVVHEVGLFQGKLGFEKAIVLLEEGCEEFSNIHGLGQIRFPKGNIKASFEEIRQVLEREGIITK